MEPIPESRVFYLNILLWRFLGMWPYKTSSVRYKIYCVIFQMVFNIISWCLFTLNLIFTPIEVENFILQATFYFTHLAILAKVSTVIMRHDDLIKAFEMLDSDEFQGDDVETRRIVKRYANNYAFFFKFCWVFYHFGGFFLLLYPLIEYWIGWSELKLPLCEYYFISDEVREKYFIVWLIFQLTGLYFMLLVDVSTDTFVNGLIWMAIAQFKVLNCEFKNLDLTVEEDKTVKPEKKEYLFVNKLKRCLIHYDHVVEYCNNIQDVLSITNFVTFGTGAAKICVTTLSIFMPMPKGKMLFTLDYTFTMMMQIFVPSRLGTELTHESQNVVTAIYFSNWAERSESFKRTFRVFVERAKRPIVLTGLKIFTLSLKTFISIFKMAYSLFTLFRNAQQ